VSILDPNIRVILEAVIEGRMSARYAVQLLWGYKGTIEDLDELLVAYGFEPTGL